MTKTLKQMIIPLHWCPSPSWRNYPQKFYRSYENVLCFQFVKVCPLVCMKRCFF